jgi:hypothetical protein
MLHQEKPTLDEDLLEHHGIKGMRWGVRREGRISRLERVGSGKGSTGDKLRVGLTEVSGLSRMRNNGLRGAAANKAANMRTRDARVASGHATVMDHLSRHGGDRIFDSGGKLRITAPVGKTAAPTAKTATATRKPGFAHEVKVSADRISVHPRMSAVTKNVVRDHNSLSNKEFFNKYQVTKGVYRSRVQKHGDPYMHRKALATRLNNSVFGRRARSSVAKKQAKEARAR